MKVSARVRKKTTEDPVMTIKRVTPQGYVVCTWENPQTGRPEERMFFPERLEEATSSTPPSHRS